MTGSVYSALCSRRSFSKLTDQAPSTSEVARFVAAMECVADHKQLRPWRVIEVRGNARPRIGAAIAAAGGEDTECGVGKTLRAPLLLAVVASPSCDAVPVWEQEAVASGVAHYLSLLLSEAGWGVIWRSGPQVRHPIVHAAHGLGEDEYLMGWLYVGGIPEGQDKPKPRRPIDLGAHLSTLTD